MLRFLPLLPVIAAICVLVFKDQKSIRYIAVAAILAVGFSISGFLIAPHRVAEELVYHSPQGEEWERGARDTRDIVYQAIPSLISACFALTVLAVIPWRKK